jgi:hypothetical protein
MGLFDLNNDNATLLQNTKGAKSRLFISSASDSESDKSNQWQSCSEFYRSVIGALSISRYSSTD